MNDATAPTRGVAGAQRGDLRRDVEVLGLDANGHPEQLSRR